MKQQKPKQQDVFASLGSYQPKAKPAPKEQPAPVAEEPQQQTAPAATDNLFDF